MGDSEASLWQDVTAAMMSDEEPLADGKVKRKRPSWRSDTFNDLVDTLDDRANASFQKSARKERILSSPAKAAAPTNCPNWMINES